MAGNTFAWVELRRKQFCFEAYKPVVDENGFSMSAI